MRQEAGEVENRIRALKEERSTLHPDKSGGGAFLSEEALARFVAIDEELDRLRDESAGKGQEMIPISQLPALIEVVGGALASTRKSSAQELERELKNSAKEGLSRKYRMPKLSSAAAAAVVGFLFTQAPSLSEHPVLGTFFASQTGLAALGYAFALALFILSIAWMREQRESLLIKQLASREHLRKVVEQLDSSVAGQLIGESDLYRLLFGRVIRGRRRVAVPFFDVSPGLDDETLDSIFEVHLQRLLERHVLKEAETKGGIERVFERL